MVMEHNRKDIITSLKKARGTLDTVLQMAENGVYCADIAHQINATMGLLKSANRELMRDHLQCCGREKLSSPDVRVVDGFIDELLRTWDMATRK
jgi:DNA-binding FrmR family transcriptional regulator